MNNDNRPNASGWYAPMAPAPERSAPQEAPTERRRGLPLGWRIFLGTLLADRKSVV